ncbi:MAG: thioredoxin family protein [Candidatus Levyibacteriota bacterium]
MAVNSTMLPLGTIAPDFNLADVVSEQSVSLETFKGKKTLLVMFICKHCPFVQHVKHEIAKIGKDYLDKGLGIIAISSNDVAEYPEDGPHGLKEMAQELDLNFPYAYDESQEVAKSYTAACTPDFFLFDKDRKLFYRGQIDASRPGNDIPVTGEDLRSAIEKVLTGEPSPKDQKPSMGCGIKWKVGNEPSYA